MYSKSEKIFYALIISVQCLRSCFQVHSVIVLTDQPLKTFLQPSDASEGMVKRAIKISEFDIYHLRPSIKAQVLADFIECTWSDDKREEVSAEQLTKQSDSRIIWILHVDGASNFQGSGAGSILINSKGVVIEYALRFSFNATNNQTKYEALLTSLKLAKQLKVQSLRVLPTLSQ